MGEKVMPDTAGEIRCLVDAISLVIPGPSSRLFFHPPAYRGEREGHVERNVEGNIGRTVEGHVDGHVERNGEGIVDDNVEGIAEDNVERE
jgi:hypothetical protein